MTDTDPVESPRETPPPLPAARVKSSRVIRIPVRVRARVPWLTYALLAANLLIFGITWSVGQPRTELLLQEYGQLRGAVRAGETWRMLTAMFLHAGVAHIGLNMLVHFLLGRLMERLLGHWRYFVLYLASGLAGALCFQVTSEAPLGVGASGAVYGVFGAFLVFRSSLRRRTTLEPLKSFLLWTVVVIGLDYATAVFIELVGGIGLASSAHFGGFTAGAALGFFWLHLPLGVSPLQRKLRLATVGALAAGIISLAGYGLYLAPVEPGADPLVWRYTMDMQRSLQEDDLDAAVEAWRQLSSRIGPSEYTAGFVEVGYDLFGSCMIRGRELLGHEVLDILIEKGLQALEVARQQETETEENAYQLPNSVAWFCAVRDDQARLPLALHLAEIAVRQARQGSGVWQWFFPQVTRRVAESLCINTRGWVHFRLGNFREAFADLEKAVELYPVGANYLYLGLAYLYRNEERAARDAARKARDAGGLSPYEKFVLQRELVDRLGEI